MEQIRTYLLVFLIMVVMCFAHGAPAATTVSSKSTGPKIKWLTGSSGAQTNGSNRVTVPTGKFTLRFKYRRGPQEADDAQVFGALKRRDALEKGAAPLEPPEPLGGPTTGATIIRMPRRRTSNGCRISQRLDIRGNCRDVWR